MHPIEQVARQKEERNAGESKLTEEGLTLEEIKVARAKKNFKHEEHADCGSDLVPLGEEPPGIRQDLGGAEVRNCCPDDSQFCELGSMHHSQVPDNLMPSKEEIRGEFTDGSPVRLA